MATKPPVQPIDFDPADVRFVRKDPSSAGGDCQSFHRVPGGWIVNGIPVSEATEAALQHRGPGERAVFINDDLLNTMRDEGLIG
jgi:hypothetical protein